MTEEQIHEEIVGPEEAEILAFTKPEPEEEARYHSVAEAWATILDGADKVSVEKPAIERVIKLVRSYPEVGYADAVDLDRLYHDRIEVLNQILLEAVKRHPGCYDVETPEQDNEENRDLYIEVLTDWQLQVVAWEIEWDAKSPTAAIEIGSLGEIQRGFFGEQGLTQYLDNIKIEFNSDDRDALIEKILELKGGDSE